jgi:hypothetical protein
MAVSVDTALAGFGPLAGTVTVINTDLTSAGAGQGSQDADDTIIVAAEAVDHANASFDSVADFNGVVVDFGTVARNSAEPPAPVSLWNLASPSGATAGLDVDSVSGSGDTGVVSIALTPSFNLAAGQARVFNATIDTSAAIGSYEAVYTVAVSDENIPGGIALGTVTVTVTATIAPGCAGDVNGDGTTDAADFVVLAGNFGFSVAPGTAGDLNSDGLVDASDFVILAGDFGCAG